MIGSGSGGVSPYFDAPSAILLHRALGLGSSCIVSIGDFMSSVKAAVRIGKGAVFTAVALQLIATAKTAIRPRVPG